MDKLSEQDQEFSHNYVQAVIKNALARQQFNLINNNSNILRFGMALLSNNQNLIQNHLSLPKLSALYYMHKLHVTFPESFSYSSPTQHTLLDKLRTERKKTNSSISKSQYFLKLFESNPAYQFSLTALQDKDFRFADKYDIPPSVYEFYKEFTIIDNVSAFPIPGNYTFNINGFYSLSNTTDFEYIKHEHDMVQGYTHLTNTELKAGFQKFIVSSLTTQSTNNK